MEGNRLFYNYPSTIKKAQHKAVSSTSILYYEFFGIISFGIFVLFCFFS